MAKRKDSVASTFSGREQTHLKQFLFRLFEEGCAPEEALGALRKRFDADDFTRVRELAAKSEIAASRDVRGPRGKH